MRVLLFTLLTAVPSSSPSPNGAECEAPPVRDVVALQTFAQNSGALSVGLDSVATWCFDSAGDFTAGSGKGKAGAGSKPVGDCARALASCEAAKTPELKALLIDALADLERPYVQKKYVPKRSGLIDRPSEVVDCNSRSRPELFAQAQARMDLARLASQAHSEYANYKTWLFAEGLKCAQAAHAGQVDTTQRQMAVDAPPAVMPNPDKSRTVTIATPTEPTMVLVTPVSRLDAGAATATKTTAATPTAATPTVTKPTAATATPATSAAAKPTAGAPTASAPSNFSVGGPSTERERLLASQPVERWLSLGQVRSRLELDRDYTLGFLASRELRDCRCQRPNPSGLARRYAQNDNVPQLEADENKNMQCEFCLQDAFAAWKLRLERQCTLVDKLSDFEVGVLQRSDDGNGLPPRCFASAMAGRDAGVPGAVPFVSTIRPLDGGALLAKITKPPVAAVAPVVAAAQPVTTPLADSFSRAQDWAPIPLREDGRLYVRLFMSSQCAADVLPGPIQARTGDLLMIPYNARQLSVRSPCGGLAEVYWGREVKPRVSEIFARNQPLHLQFQPQ